jgi:hypothetical protein
MLAIISRMVPAALAHSAAQVQTVIGDRQPAAARRLQQVLRRDFEVLEDDAPIVRVLERVQAVLHQLEVLVFFRRQIDDEHRRLVLDETNQANRAPRHDIGDE